MPWGVIVKRFRGPDVEHVTTWFGFLQKQVNPKP